MIRKIFRTGNSQVVSLPGEMLISLGVSAGSDVRVELDTAARQITIRPLEVNLAGVDEEFARQVTEFIQEYRPALETLAR